MADVSVKMGVSGIAQFKKGMTDSQAAVKSLDAALKYNEKQLKASGNAEKDFTTQANLLNAKLKEQKNIVANAEKALKQMEQSGVKTTSAAYQNMQRRMIEAQSAILDTESALRNLGTTSEEVAGQTNQLQQSLGGLNKKVSLGQVQDALKSIGGVMESAAKKAVDLGKAIWDNIVDTARYSDDVVTAATRLGISTEEYQQLKGVLDTVGDMTVEEWKKAKRKVQGAIYDPTADQENILALLGIQTHEGSWGKEGWVQGAARDYEDVFWEIGEKLRQKVESGEMSQDLAETYAQTMFGKGYDALNGIFGMGREAFDAKKGEIATAEEEALRKNAELNDKIITLQGNFNALKQELVSGLSPALTKVAETVSGLLKEFNDYLKTEEGKKKMEELSKAVEELFGGLSDITPEGVIDTAKSILEGIVTSLKWIATNKNKVVDGIKAIIGAWAAVKTAQGITTMLNLVNGVRGLSAGGAAVAGTSVGTSWGTAFGAAVLKAVPWLAGALVLTRGVWDDNYVAPGEMSDESGNATSDAIEEYREALMNYAGGGTRDDNQWIENLMMLNELFSDINPNDMNVLNALSRWRSKGRNTGDLTQLISDLESAGYTKRENIGETVERYRQGSQEQTEKRAEKLARMEARLDPVTKAMEQEQAAREEVAEALEQETKKGRINSESTPEFLGMPVDFRLLGAALGGFLGWGFASNLNQKLASDQQKAQIEAEAVISDPAENREEITESFGVVDLPARLVVTGHVGPDGYLHGGGGSSKDLIFESTQPNYHANGIFSVPFDGYSAILHKGERVLPAREAGSSRNFSSNLYVESMVMNNGTDAAGLAAAMAAAQKRTMSGYGS